LQVKVRFRNDAQRSSSAPHKLRLSSQLPDTRNTTIKNYRILLPATIATPA
jgi:hypothetical protein